MSGTSQWLRLAWGCVRGFSSLTVTGSLIIKKGSGERPIERCFLWRNIAARWKKPQTPFVLTFNERDDAFVTDIPLGPSDLQITEEPDKSAWCSSRPDSLGSATQRCSLQINPSLNAKLSCSLRSVIPDQEQTERKTLASVSALPRGFCKAWRRHCQICTKH